MFNIGIANRIALNLPNLKGDLRRAHLHVTPLDFVKKSLYMSILASVLFTAISYFVLQKSSLSAYLLFPIFIIFLFLLFQYFLLALRAKIVKREHEIDKEVLFIGRYLLVKLYSGRSLLSALTETATSRGVAGKFIKGIVDDISTGNTIEESLDNAMTYTPSDKLRRVLFYINNALQLGIDVTTPLESVLQGITKDEELEIKKYGRKLNTIVIFYMLFAVIIPSLGVAMFIAVSSFIRFPINLKGLLFFIGFIILIQFIFITMFRSIRPNVNL